MTPADAVLEDALREAGYTHVTAWHLRCVEAYLAQFKALVEPEPGDDRAAIHAETRLRDDLKAGSLDALHGQAQRIDAPWR